MAAKRIEQESQALADLIEAYKDNLLVAIFYAKWCDPCMDLLRFVLPAIAKQTGEEVVICPINIEEARNHSSSKKHGVMNVPVTLFIKEGKEVGRISGMIKIKGFMHEIKIHQKK